MKRRLARAGIFAAAALAALMAWSCAGGSGDAIDIPSAAIHEAMPAKKPADAAAPGLVYGEFEDARLFFRELKKRPEMGSWSARGMWEGLSGATIQYKTYGRDVPDRIVLVDGVETAFADGFGQYWIELPPGEYAITGRCAGFKDAEARLLIEPGSLHYLNFYLRK